MTLIWTGASVAENYPDGAGKVGCVSTLPETNSLPLEIGPWKRRFLLETTIFRGKLLVSGRVSVSFLEGRHRFFVVSGSIVSKFSTS